MINCPKCRSFFDPGKYKKKYCSRKCANSRTFSEESKKKKSDKQKMVCLLRSKEDQSRIDILFAEANIRRAKNAQKRIEANIATPAQQHCLDCNKFIPKINKHKRCQECYYKSDACVHALAHNRNYVRRTVIDSHGNTVYLLSSLEFRYYNWLLKNNIKWKKPESIYYIDDKNKRRWYRPDFYLIDTEEFVEIKGYWWNNDKIKMDRVIEQNQELKIIVLTKEKIENLGA